MPVPRRYPLPTATLIRYDSIGKRTLSMLTGAASGLALGVMTDEQLRLTDERYYATKALYTDDDYNAGGLWSWEERVLIEHFGDCNRLAVLSAGGGREVLALAKRGFEVTGFEHNSTLASYANEFLGARGCIAPVLGSAPSQWPPHCDRVYDGIVLGWGAFTHGHSSKQRIAWLSGIRAHLRPKGPLLLSFFSRKGSDARFRITAGIANGLRRLRGTQVIETGDDLRPNFVHFFSEMEIRAELQAAGFSVATYSTREYPHAVAINP